MNILFINHYAGAPKLGMEFRPFYLGREWSKKGHKVAILGASYSHLRQKNPVVSEDFQFEDIQGLSYYWFKTPEYTGNGLGRLLNIFTFVFKLLFNSRKIAKQFMPQVVVASSTYPLDVIPALLIAKFSKAKVIHEVHDLWPLTLTEIGGLSKMNPFVVLLQWAENFSYRNVDRVVSMLEAAFPYMQEHGLSEDRFVAVSNGVVEDEWISVKAMPQDLDDLCKKLRAKQHLILGYTGYLGLANSVGTLVDAIKFLKKENVSLVILGSGPEKEKLIEMCEAEDLKNIYFYGSIEKQQIPSFLAEVDATFIGAPKSSLYRYGVSPNKLLDYLMAGKPILYAIEAGNNWVDESKSGISVSSENAAELAQAIRDVMRMSTEERVKMGNNGREFVLRSKTYPYLAQKFIEGIFD
ncbi:glycosyltransferase family 4 protein [Bdellovibrio sp. BCCA]|uniref:glycosyltransferase family 4 protein n=1 Tax=Bdellovibrio sp. BCCA TaxID=3136281 RepID=UPI0030F0D71C